MHRYFLNAVIFLLSYYFKNSLFLFNWKMDTRPQDGPFNGLTRESKRSGHKVGDIFYLIGLLLVWLLNNCCSQFSDDVYCTHSALPICSGQNFHGRALTCLKRLGQNKSNHHWNDRQCCGSLNPHAFMDWKQDSKLPLHTLRFTTFLCWNTNRTFSLCIRLYVRPIHNVLAHYAN